MDAFGELDINRQLRRRLFERQNTSRVVYQITLSLNIEICIGKTYRSGVIAWESKSVNVASAEYFVQLGILRFYAAILCPPP